MTAFAEALAAAQTAGETLQSRFRGLNLLPQQLLLRLPPQELLSLLRLTLGGWFRRHLGRLDLRPEDSLPSLRRLVSPVSFLLRVRLRMFRQPAPLTPLTPQIRQSPHDLSAAVFPLRRHSRLRGSQCLRRSA